MEGRTALHLHRVTTGADGVGRTVSLAGQELYGFASAVLWCASCFWAAAGGVCFQIKIKLQKRSNCPGAHKMPWWMPKALVENDGVVTQAYAPPVVCNTFCCCETGPCSAALTSLDSDCRNLALAYQMLGCKTCVPRLWDGLAWECSVNQQQVHSSS